LTATVAAAAAAAAAAVVVQYASLADARLVCPEIAFVE